ncbi:MAG: hypothetical protein PHW04_05345 [Candidatus Wallbacteria bacterium]|nr:hypothetical protein [Candidatus Wallbacteria bacterium]
MREVNLEFSSGEKKKKLKFSSERLTDYLGILFTNPEFFPDSALKRLSYYTEKKTKLGKGEDRKFLDFLEYLHQQKLIFTKGAFNTLARIEKFAPLIKQLKENRNFYLIKVDKVNWEEFVVKEVLGFKVTLRLLSDLKPGDEVLVCSRDQEILGWAKVLDCCVFCNTTLINNGFLPYQVSVSASSWKGRVFFRKEGYPEEINALESDEYFKLLALVIEKQLEYELFEQRGLLPLFSEMEEKLAEFPLLTEKVVQMLKRLAEFYHFQLNIKEDIKWKYFEFGMFGRVMFRLGFNCDLIPYLAKKYYSNNRFKVLVPGRSEEAENLISLERIWYIFNAMQQLTAEMATLLT